jgi:hypothetical protein
MKVKKMLDEADWLYQVRMRVTESLSDELRGTLGSCLAKKIVNTTNNHGARLVCVYDGFKIYCLEAEENGIDEYHLYEWTKTTIENPEKKQKYLKAFSFYKGNDQIYEKEFAVSLEAKMRSLAATGEIEEVTLIDTNPANNPHPLPGRSNFW